jgi:hypothetical protein
MVHQETDNRWWISRLGGSIKNIWEEKGTLTGLSLAAGVPFVALSTCFLAYLCFEGAGRSLQEVYSSIKHEADLSHDIGDAGGWISLPMDVIFALLVGAKQVIHEGEYLKLKEICKEWHDEMSRQGVSVNNEEAYSKISDILNALSGQCFTSKNLVDRKLYALNIMRELFTVSENKENMNNGLILSEYHCDKELGQIYKNIQLQKTELSARNFFNRARRGISRPLIASQLSIGFASPAIYTLTALMSGVGFVVLAKEVLGERIYLDMTGHVGEWGLNSLISLFAAYFMNKWFVLNEGDLKILKNIFNDQLQALDPKVSTNGNQDLYEHLCKVANTEMEAVASGCFHFKLPMDYKI